MDLDGFQKQVDDFIKTTEDGYWEPLAMLAAIIEELGETARLINTIEGNKPVKKSHNIEKIHDLLQEELGDTLFALSCIANYYDISLIKALEKTLSKYQKRNKS